VDSPISTADINMHYASVSTDVLYTAPLPKNTCKCEINNHSPWPGPYQVLNALETHKSKATGADKIPPWFARLAAPFLAQPLSTLFSKSIHQSIVPSQWKEALITPIPKNTGPLSPADFRPISVLPMFSTILEKFVVRHCIYPLLSQPPLRNQISDQYAFRPTGSTSAAVISLLHSTTTLLQTDPYVHIIALDFSKAFDVVRHSSLFTKLAALPLADNIYEWLIDFFTDRTHRTKFNSELSSKLPINASVVQGSALGPAMFILNMSDLHCVKAGNIFVKYADDAYLLVPASNSHTIPSELDNIETWSLSNNQKLNVAKSSELIVWRRPNKNNLVSPPTSGIKRVTEVNMLGVIIDQHLNFSQHLTHTISSASQSLYALKVLKNFGQESAALSRVFTATVVSKLTYASPCWWGSVNTAGQQQLQSVLNRGFRWGLCGISCNSMADLCQKADINLG
jgi:hypothetical protein